MAQQASAYDSCAHKQEALGLQLELQLFFAWH